MEPTPKRRPGELVFNIAVMLASFGLLYSAYGISGFEALSAPGAVPMATTAIMAVCAIIILVQTLRKGTGGGQTMAADILPLIVIVTIAMYFGEGQTPVEEILSRAGWQDITAVKNGDILNLQNNELSRPGPRIADGAQAMFDFVKEIVTKENAA